MRRLALRGGRLLAPDGRAFEEAGHTLLIEDGMIAARVPDAHGPPPGGDVEVVELDGRWVVPGLIDAHCHLVSRSAAVVDDELVARGILDGVAAAADLLRGGVTFLRDPGCRHRGIYALRAALAAGEVAGPRIAASGPNVTGVAAPREWRNVIGDGPDEIRRLVHDEAAAGADWIKLIVSQVGSRTRWLEPVWFMSPAEVAAAVDEAHRCGLAVGCHCEGRDAAVAVLDAGVDCIDHGTVLDDELVARMVAAGTAYVPTAWAYSTARMIEEGNFAGELAPLHTERVQRPHRETVLRAWEAGVPIAAGSDASAAAAGDLVAELVTLRACGIPDAALLRAATVDAAAVAGVGATHGALAPGRVGDAVVLDGDPLADVERLRAVALVVQGGVVVHDGRDADGAGVHGSRRTDAAGRGAAGPGATGRSSR